MSDPAVTIASEAESNDSDVFSQALLRRLRLPIAFAVLAYGALLFYADAEAIVRHTGEVAMTVLVVGTVLAASNFVVRFFRWQFYLRELSISLPLVESALVFLAGFAMSITPGKMGEVIKSLLLKESHSIPVARSAPIVLAERVTDLSGLLILGGVGLLAVPQGLLAAMASLAMVAFLFAVCAFHPLGNAMIDFSARIPRVARLREKLQFAYDSLATLTRPLPFTIGVIYSVVAWGLQCVSLNVIAWGFPHVTLSLQHGLLAYSAPLLAGTLALIPGGLGLTEASMTGALQTLGGPGVTPSVAAAITILSRLSSFWLAIALGFAALALWRARRARA